jgi:hypothetical protein
MAFNQFPQKGGIPSGATAARPASPVIGDTFYDGTLGFLMIWSGTEWIPCSAPAAQPSITATDVGTSRPYGSGAISVAFTEGNTGGKAAGFTATASSYTQTSTSSTVTLTVGDAGTYSVSGTAYNGFGTSPTSPSTSVTVTTVPSTPTIGAVTNTGAGGTVSVAFTAAANTGGKTITGYTATSTPGNITASSTSSPVVVTGLTNGTSYTFKVKAQNANGFGAESSASGSVTPSSLAAVTGGTLTTDSTYAYRTFTANGTLAISNQSLTGVEFIVLGGGGGGGGAGGGAGGLFYASGQTLTTGSRSVTVGAGGPPGNGNITSAGADSTFGSFTAGKGGGAGGWGSNDPADLIGGCGGGQYGTDAINTQYGGNTNQTGTGGTGYGTSNTGTVGQRRSGGGGAGLGSAGSNASGQNGGTGGAGSNTFSTWSSVTGIGTSNYLGGGGGGGGESGGANGQNGGGNGVSGGGTATSGATNTGSGGGGKYGAPSGTGGSGVVIVRYTKSQTGE